MCLWRWCPILQVVHVLLHIVMSLLQMTIVCTALVCSHPTHPCSPQPLPPDTHTRVLLCSAASQYGHIDVCSHLEDDKETASKRGGREKGKGRRKKGRDD